MSQLLDDNLIDLIVAGVMDRLRGNSVQDIVEPKLRQAINTDNTNPTALTVVIPDRVVTEAVLMDSIGQARRVEFADKAVLTPTARDYLRINKITWRHGNSSITNENAATLIIIVNEAPTVERITRELLPAARREMLGCVDEAARLASAEIARGGCELALIFSHQIHRAACRANRQHAVRAAAARDAAETLAIQSQLRANVWCLDPTNRGGFELKNIIKAISSSAARGTGAMQEGP